MSINGKIVISPPIFQESSPKFSRESPSYHGNMKIKTILAGSRDFEVCQFSGRRPDLHKYLCTSGLDWVHLSKMERWSRCFTSSNDLMNMVSWDPLLPWYQYFSLPVAVIPRWEGVSNACLAFFFPPLCLLNFR